MKPDWDALANFIKGKKRLLITTHVHPDGDAIGSQVAMIHYLEGMGAETVALNMDPTPKFFKFLDPEDRIAVFDAKQHHDLFQSLEGAIVLDISDWGRLREIGKRLRSANCPVACIDHHIVTDVLGEVQIAIESACSTGELLYDFFIHQGIRLNSNIVNALYTCILTDTGSFRFSNTNARTHRIAADLMERGADFRKIYQQVYENYSKNRSLLKGHLLADMHFECGNRLAWFALTRELLARTGAELWEAEGLSELPRSIDEVEVSLLFTETDDSTTKVSLRSKGRVPVNDLAVRFGGGGHKYASGITLSMPLGEAIERIIPEVKQLLS